MHAQTHARNTKRTTNECAQPTAFHSLDTFQPQSFQMCRKGKLGGKAAKTHEYPEYPCCGGSQSRSTEA